MLACCLGLGGFIIFSVGERALSFWAFAWSTVALSAVLYVVGNSVSESGIYLGFVSDGLFAPLIYMGALAYAGRRVSYWPLALGLVAGVARGVLEVVSLRDLQALLAITVAPALLFASVLVVFRAPEREPLRLPMAFFLAAFAIEEVWDGYIDWSSNAVVVPWTLVFATAIPLALNDPVGLRPSSFR